MSQHLYYCYYYFYAKELVGKLDAILGKMEEVEVGYCTLNGASIFTIMPRS